MASRKSMRKSAGKQPKTLPRKRAMVMNSFTNPRPKSRVIYTSNS